MKTRIYLVRHGESEHNVGEIISGQVNPALTPAGKQQAKEARQKFKDVKFDEVYTSDLDRAIHTAEILVQKPVHSDNQLIELREVSYGSLDGRHAKHLKKTSEIKKQLPEEEKWHFKHVPDMESDHELISRYLPALEDLAKKHEGQTILIVVHGTAIKIVLRKLLDLPASALPSGSFANAGHIVLDYEDGKLAVVQAPGADIQF